MKIIFFDLDGTLADSTDLFVTTFNKITRWIPWIKPLNKHKFHDIPIEDLIKSSRVPQFIIPLGLYLMRINYQKQASQIKLFPESTRILAQLKTHYELGIITTSTKTYLNTIINNNGIGSYFTHLISQASLLNKADTLKKFAKENNLQLKDIIIVSDEARDIKSFQTAKIPIIAVTWGYDKRKILEKTNAKHIVDTPEELLQTINSLNGQN